MISKTSAMNLYSGLPKVPLNNTNNAHFEYDDEYVCENLKKASLSVSNNFGEVVKKFKSTFLNN